jgi:hypothetical protein
MTAISVQIPRSIVRIIFAALVPRSRRPRPELWLTALAATLTLALALTPAAQAGADEPSATTPTAPPAQAGTPGATSTPASTPTPSSPSEGPGETGAGTGVETGAASAEPQVQAQHLQHNTPAGPTGTGGGHARAPAHGNGALEKPGGGGQSPQTQATGGTSGSEALGGRRAQSPSALTPGLPLSLGDSIAGVPRFFIESFRVPPFLLPIYQAAGTAYGIPWQVLAAINEIETDYGRDLSVSSAGAEGWMQFLPATWAQYGVDANGDGFKDPYNPADAIFAAARYLRAAGGDTNIRAAVDAYNHSQAYVDSVMLRAQLLGGTPPGLLGAVTGLTEARFPVHAPSRFGDGFQTIPAHGPGDGPARTLVGTTIYARAGAPVIAVQDGEVVQIGDSSALGRFVALRDAYGNTYVYAQLGGVAALYPVLRPRIHTVVSPRIGRPDGGGEPAPGGPATAGAQQRSPLSTAAAISGLALGAAAGLEPAPTAPVFAPAVPRPPVAPSKPTPASTRVFRSGSNDVYLHPLSVGVQVIAGTVLGHVGAAGGAGPAGTHVFFQIRPAGLGAPPIDPKPILDGWVALENTSIFRAKGENPFLATSPTIGQVLLESKGQLEQQVAHDASIHMRVCERRDLLTGRVDRRVLAMLEFLSVSGLKPTVAGLGCASATTPAATGNAAASGGGDTVRIVAVGGVPIAGHQGQGSIADTTIRRLLTLQGVNRPLRIVSLTSVAGAANAIVKPSARNYIDVVFGPAGGGGAHAAGASFGSALSAREWIELIARLGEIPDPTVAGGPSAAALPDTPGTPPPAGGASAGGGPYAAPGTSGPGESGAGTSAGTGVGVGGGANGHG